MPSFKATAVQTRAGITIAGNILSLSALVREAAALGATYIQTPEMSNILQPNRPLFFQEIKSQAQEPMLHAMQALAQELNITLHLGSLAIKLTDTRAANRSFLIAPTGKIVAQYDKINMFDVTLPDGTIYKESAAYQAGNQEIVATLPFGAIGMTICYDMRFPQLYRTLALKGAALLAIPSSFTVPTGQAHWHVLLRARAIETGCFLIAAAQGGKHECGRETYGHSLIINPWGEIIAEACHDNPCVIIGDIDLKDVALTRARIPSLSQ